MIENKIGKSATVSSPVALVHNTRPAYVKARELLQNPPRKLRARRNKIVGSLRKRRRAEIIAPSCPL